MWDTPESIACFNHALQLQLLLSLNTCPEISTQGVEIYLHAIQKLASQDGARHYWTLDRKMRARQTRTKTKSKSLSGIEIWSSSPQPSQFSLRFEPNVQVFKNCRGHVTSTGALYLAQEDTCYRG
jgi:hypothetical protein